MTYVPNGPSAVRQAGARQSSEPACGRLFIQPDGVVTVQAENSFSDAQCFTSLDGTSFVR